MALAASREVNTTNPPARNGVLLPDQVGQPGAGSPAPTGYGCAFRNSPTRTRRARGRGLDDAESDPGDRLGAGGPGEKVRARMDLPKGVRARPKCAARGAPLTAPIPAPPPTRSPPRPSLPPRSNSIL